LSTSLLRHHPRLKQFARAANGICRTAPWLLRPFGAPFPGCSPRLLLLAWIDLQQGRTDCKRDRPEFTKILVIAYHRGLISQVPRLLQHRRFPGHFGRSELAATFTCTAQLADRRQPPDRPPKSCTTGRQRQSAGQHARVARLETSYLLMSLRNRQYT